MAKRAKARMVGNNFVISIANEHGEFVPIEPLPPSKRHRIVCVPTPGPDGVHWVPDWWDLTEFG